jgi:hypothetical protein
VVGDRRYVVCLNPEEAKRDVVHGAGQDRGGRRRPVGGAVRRTRPAASARGCNRAQTRRGAVAFGRRAPSRLAMHSSRCV